MKQSRPKIIKRKGGRPLKYGEPTMLCRIPVSFEPTLSVLLDLWSTSAKDLISSSARRSLMTRAEWLKRIVDQKSKDAEGGDEYD